jgi:dihydrofolate reductase
MRDKPLEKHQGQAGGTLRSARFHLCVGQGAGRQFVWFEVGTVKMALPRPTHQRVSHKDRGTSRKPLGVSTLVESYQEAHMRKIFVLTFITVDGVMQAPGGPGEDDSGNFKYGGWTVPYFDDSLGKIMTEQISHPFDLLLGRRTFEIFAAYWPHHQEEGAGINNATKYVASNTLKSHEWSKSVFLSGDVVKEIRKLKQEDGPELQVHGSANLIQTLLQHDLVDEFWLKIFPVTLGVGKRLFDTGAIPAAYTLVESKSSTSGVIVANFKRAGEVKTGSF